MADDWQPDRKGMAELMRGHEMQQLCMTVAWDYVPRVAGHTPRDSGDTAGSTRAEEDRLPDGTAGSKIVQDGASVPSEFGNQHVSAQHYMHSALGNGA